MVGCTDYSDDIQNLEDATNKSIEQLKADVDAKINQLKADFAATYATQEMLDEVEEGLLEEINSSVEDLQNQINAKASKEELATAVADLEGQISALETKLNAAIAAAEARLKELIDANTTKINANTVAINNLKTTVETLQADVTTLKTDVAALKETVDEHGTKIAALETSVALLDKDVKDLKGRMAAAEENIKTLQTDLDAAETKIAALEGKVADLQTKVDANTKDIEAINTEIDDLQDEVDALSEKLTSEINAIKSGIARRIQSVAFVPEFDDFSATAIHYVLAQVNYLSTEGEIAQVVSFLPEDEDYYVVRATYQIKPAALAKSIKEAYEAEEPTVALYLQAVETETRAANAIVESTDLRILGIQNDCIEVEAKLPVAELGDNFGVSLFINDIEANELKNEVASCYVPVVFEDVNLADKYVYYAAETEEYYFEAEEPNAEGQSHDCAWDVVDNAYAFHTGYDVMMDLGEGPVTLEEAADELGLTVEELTPEYTIATSGLYTAPGTKETTPCAFNVNLFKVNDESAETLEVSFVENKPSSAGHSAVVTNLWTVNDVLVLTFDDIYNITNRILDVYVYEDAETKTNVRIDWDYKFAVEHSSAKTPETLHDLSIVLDGLEIYTDDEYFDAAKLTGSEPVTSYYTVAFDEEGKEVLTKIAPIGVDGTWFRQADNTTDPKKITAVISKGYKFDVKDVQYRVDASYIDLENASEVIAHFDFVMGPKPTKYEVTFDRSEDPLAFDPKADYLKAKVAEPTIAAFDAVPGAYDVEGKKIADYFAADEDFVLGFHDAEYSKTCYVGAAGPGKTIENKYHPISYYDIQNNEKEDLGIFTYVNVWAIASFDDYYDFKLVATPWYGVEYTVNVVDVNVTEPEYVLSYWDDLTKEYEGAISELAGQRSAKLNGFIDTEALDYRIENADLSKYYKVIGEIPATDVDYYYVKYELDNEFVKTHTPEMGYVGYEDQLIINNPLASVKAGNQVYGIEESEFQWHDFTAREVKVKAQLVMKRAEGTAEVAVGEPCPLILTIIDPIKTFDLRDPECRDSKVVEIIRRPYDENVIINIPAHLSIVEQNFEPQLTGVNGDEMILANGTLKPKHQEYYDLKLTYADEIKYWIGDVEQFISPEKIEYDNVNGTIHYKMDSADMTNDVTIEVNVGLEHKYNYNNVSLYEEHINGFTFKFVITQKDFVN